MGRALLVILDDQDRQKAQQWARKAPTGTRIEFKSSKRTLPQNDRMWAMLSDVATQKEHHGRKYTTNEWKVLFMHALGKEMDFMPGLDGKSFFPVGYSSSDLSVDEMSDLIEFMFSWGAENGVTFHEPH